MEESLSYQLAYMTCAHEAEARKIANILLDRKLVACCNILPKMTSIYSWDGTIQEATEVILLAKSKGELQEDIQHCVQEHHTYQTPCLIFLGIDGGLPSYLDWVSASVAAADPKSSC